MEEINSLKERYEELSDKLDKTIASLHSESWSNVKEIATLRSMIFIADFSKWAKALQKESKESKSYFAIRSIMRDMQDPSFNEKILDACTRYTHYVVSYRLFIKDTFDRIIFLKIVSFTIYFLKGTFNISLKINGLPAIGNFIFYWIRSEYFNSEYFIELKKNLRDEDKNNIDTQALKSIHTNLVNFFNKNPLDTINLETFRDSKFDTEFRNIIDNILS